MPIDQNSVLYVCPVILQKCRQTPQIKHFRGLRGANVYIDDCLEGLLRLMSSDCGDALSLGTDRLVTINRLVDILSGLADKHLRTSSPEQAAGCTRPE